jgi:uncharacterized protein YydD (DUF2326 family)
MFLKELVITKENGKIIRSIPFHPGLNLIVDETPVETGKETGNSVGKTTVLKLIDFCLGAKANIIYTDNENFKNEYTIVKDFLINNNVMIQLILRENLTDEKSKLIFIERNFRSNKEKIIRINGKEIQDQDFIEELTKVFFPNRIGKKPTFRQIISHNIRYTNQSLENTLQTLHPYTKLIEYSSLYLYMFGCEFGQDDEKLRLTQKISEEEKFKKKLEHEGTRSAYESALAVLENEIDELEKEKSLITINPNFDRDLENLNGLKYKINRTTSDITNLELRRSLIFKSQEEMHSKISNINSKQLKQIYSQAKSVLLDNLHKTFDDLVAFHNKMINSKIDFISKELPDIDIQLKELYVALHGFQAEEKRLNDVIINSSSFSDLEEIIAKLNSAYEKKGKYEALIARIQTAEQEIQGYMDKLSSIDSELFSDEYKKRIQSQINIFSKYFSQVSNQLYGEKYALGFEEETDNKGNKVYRFLPLDLNNFSSGKKQGEISCFDIAYTMFADNEKIPCMHFLLNDKKELMHDNQLINIAKYVNNHNIQFVASILNDKLPNELRDEKYIAVKLSQQDKLFGIESEIEDEENS